MDHIALKAAINSKDMEISWDIIPSMKKYQTIKLVQVKSENKTYSFIMRVINKDLRFRSSYYFYGQDSTDPEGGMYMMVKEISVRMQTNFSGLRKLAAIRASPHFVFEFEEICDMGPALSCKDDVYIRNEKTKQLASIVKNMMPEGVDVTPSPSGFYNEAEAAFIMWHVFRTIRELHTSQICHLDIRPDNIYLTSDGNVKLGGLSFISSFQEDLFGGLRQNLPGKIEYLLPEYWQGYRVSCYAADIWAAAVSLYVLIKGEDPFPMKRLDEHMERMSNYTVTPQLDGFSDELYELLSACLSPVMAQRPTLDSILRFAWFKKYGFEDDPNYKVASCKIASPRTITEESIPSSWTHPEYTQYEKIYDTIFNEQVEVMSGRDLINKEDSDVVMPAAPQEKPAYPLVSLPMQGSVGVKEGSCCCMFWIKKELYVERGKIVIGGLRKPNSRTIDTHDILTWSVRVGNSNELILSLRNGEVFLMKADSQESRQKWFEAINLSMSLARKGNQF